MNYPKTTKIDSVTLHSLCFQISEKKIFCTKSLQAMKSGFFMITLNVENHGLTLVNFRHRRQSPMFTPKKFCSVSGGIKKVYFITNCYNRETITADRYQQQLTNVSDALEEKRPFTGQGHRKVIVLYDNARPYVAKATQNYILALAGKLLLHAAYSPDMASSDYNLFRLLQHHLADIHFVRFEEIQNPLMILSLRSL